jgi:hypothetical protein
MNKRTKLQIKSVEDLMTAIDNDIEWLSTTEGDEIECIGVENLMGILQNYFDNNNITE